MSDLSNFTDEELGRAHAATKHAWRTTAEWRARYTADAERTTKEEANLFTALEGLNAEMKLRSNK